MSERWMGVGRSDAPGGAEAGREAAREALAGPDPALLVVFASDQLDAEAMLGAIAAEAPDAELIGCSTAGEISGGGASSASVVVSALGGPGFRVETSVAEGASERLRDAGRVAAKGVDRLPPDGERLLILLSDGLAGDQQEIVRGAYAQTGAAVRLVGGCAGDEGRMERTAQFHGTRVMTDAVVGAAVRSTGGFGIGVRHGWRRVGDPMLITSSRGTRVESIDSRPALDVYLERLEAPDEVHADLSAFTEFARTHPLGLASRRGEEQVRFISDADFHARTITSIAELPEGSLAWFMEGDDESVLAATDAACKDALASLPARPPLGLLAFDCIARKSVLGETRQGDEVARVLQHAAGAPVAGFYTYGEFARTSGVNGFHNQTLVLLAIV